MQRIFALLLFCMFYVNYSESYNILVVFPHFGKSHFLVFKPLFEQLNAIGHNLTVISYFPREKVIANYRDVDLNDGRPLPEEVLKLDDFGHSRLEHYQGSNQLVEFATISCPMGLSSKNFQNFLKEHNQFDLLLFEVFNTNCFYGLAKIFNAPIVGLSSSNVLPWMHNLFGFPENPSHIPCLFMDYSSKMGFLGRVENTLITVYSNLAFRYLLAGPGYQYSKQYMGIDMTDGTDPLYNMSMILLNTHYSFIKARSFAPNVVEVGGIHIAKPKPLPENLEKFINESKDGVIYVSMGSMLKGHTFPKEQRKIFIEVFSKLPQRVIWKWETDTIEGNPGNILPVRWTPQRDILCHPNVQVFVGHGGLLGSLEAVQCGIPMIIMPQYGDQHSNAKALESAGIAQILQLRSVTEKKLLNVLTTALTLESQQKAQKVSARFKDRPLSPMDTATYWIEYVARHGGTEFLRPASMELTFYQYYLLDVIAFLLLMLFLIIYTVRSIAIYLVNKFSSPKPVKKTKRS